MHLPLQLWWVSYWWCGTVQINARKCISSSFVHFRKPRILITSSESEEKATFTFYSCCFLILRSDASRARNQNLRPLFNTNIPPISGNYCLRNHFWPLESGFLMTLFILPIRKLKVMFKWYEVVTTGQPCKTFRKSDVMGGILGFFLAGLNWALVYFDEVLLFSRKFGVVTW